MTILKLPTFTKCIAWLWFAAAAMLAGTSAAQQVDSKNADVNGVRLRGADQRGGALVDGAGARAGHSKIRRFPHPLVHATGIAFIHNS